MPSIIVKLAQIKGYLPHPERRKLNIFFSNWFHFLNVLLIKTIPTISTATNIYLQCNPKRNYSSLRPLKWMGFSWSNSPQDCTVMRTTVLNAIQNTSIKVFAKINARMLEEQRDNKRDPQWAYSSVHLTTVMSSALNCLWKLFSLWLVNQESRSIFYMAYSPLVRLSRGWQ